MPDMMNMSFEDMKRQLVTNAVAQQNDAFRKGLMTDESVGRWLTTPGICSEGSGFLSACIATVQTYDHFTEDNDPHGDHSFGVMEIEGKKVWWKIDLYDRDYKGGSPAPANIKETRRVLTILFPSEY